MSEDNPNKLPWWAEMFNQEKLKQSQQNLIDNPPTVDTDEIYKKGFKDGWNRLWIEMKKLDCDEEEGKNVRPQGEWYYSCDKGWECNKCHKTVKDMPIDDNKKATYSFCPNCGADMRGEEE